MSYKNDGKLWLFLLKKQFIKMNIQFYKIKGLLKKNKKREKGE